MISAFVKRPLFTLSLFIVILIIGLYGLGRLPLDFLPNIEIPTLTIITPYPGASAEDIETTVSKVIEDAVATVPNIDKITSDSQENLSTVTLSFKWGTKLDVASADVRDKMDLVRRNLPKDVDPPTIYKFDLSQIPILTIGLSADESFNKLYELADKQISRDLKRIPGVGTVIISGGLKRQINIEIDRQKLEAYHLSIGQVNMALQAANLSLPAGSLKSGMLDYGIRVPGEYQNMEEIKRTVIGTFNEQEIHLSAIAEVADAFKEQDNLTEINKRPGIMLQIQKQSGVNTVQVAASVKKALDRILLDLPPDLKLTYVQDTSESILRQIEELTHTLYWSFFFVILTVLFFLRNIRSSFIISLAIPFSILAAFIYMFMSNTSINIISLSSIIISIGVVVDDAIVMLENIYRHRDKKKEGPIDSAINGANEVAGAVLASTTTNLVIFLPLLLIPGFVGIFFSQLSLITIVVISMSFITAVSLTPMLCSKILDLQDHSNKNSLASKFFVRSEEIFETIENSYRRAIEWALSHRRLVISSMSILFVLSMFMFSLIGNEFFPEQDNGFISGTLIMPSGTRWDQTALAMKKIEEKITKNIPELEFVMISAGSSARMSLSTRSGPNYGQIFVRVVPLSHRKRSIQEIQRQIAGFVYSTPGVKLIDFSSSGANQIAGGGKPLTIEIYGSDFIAIDQVVETLRPKIEKIPGVVDLNISREKANPEYSLTIDRDKASDLGLSMYDIAMAARASIYGNVATKYREAGDEYDVFVRLKEGSRKNIEDIKNVNVTTRLGQNITLGNIAKVELKNAPQVIQRKNQQRYVRIESDCFGRPLGDVINEARIAINKIILPENVSVKIAGSAEQIQESFRSLTVSLLLGLALIYLVMVAQFESFMDPFVVMFAVPFAIVGVVWALFLSGTAFSIMSFIGLILVTGVAVKNSIVLVDYINILRQRGTELKEAILEAGKTRLRPILMTTSTALLGLMPIIINTGESAGFWKPMAIAVVGGLLVSATVSLIFVPTVYYVIESRMK